MASIGYRGKKEEQGMKTGLGGCIHTGLLYALETKVPLSLLTKPRTSDVRLRFLLSGNVHTR